MVLCEDSRNLMTKLKGKRVSPENQKKRDECITAAITLKKKDDSPTSQKKRDDCVIASRLNKRHGFTTAASQKKRNKCTVVVSQNKRDDCLTAEITEEVSVRRKHHIVWTIAEVRKLIDGVSQYGVGRWSRIKKLFFSTSAHRTSVDLKDKWRNLLKASGIQEQGNQQGEKKRNVAWRPLPKSILRRVCELATMYPYPKGQRLKIAHINHDSPDRNTDITLNDYRSILRSINGN
uniref:Telomere repeat-binding factor like-protein n=1 Tax=Rehmannia glutinosa TaxID=99300 RepID=A0A0K1SBG8_REHGL|nr:telomere repeat-binding factor like-protein [Rehmannia glutinosa]